MVRYNKYINNFANNAEYETYINGSFAEVPNTALIDETGKMIYAKILPNNYVMFGTTTGTQDFMIGSSSSESSNADCIQVHVFVEDDSGINKMYVAPEDVLKIPKYFYEESNGFGTTEGRKIVSISKWKIDTSNVVSVERMFYDCKSLTSLDLTSFATNNVTNMSGMFSGCKSLTSLDLTSFATNNVTNMNGICDGCKSLTLIDLSSFDTSKTTEMGYMFRDCYKLNKLYLSSSFFNSTSVTRYDFYGSWNWTDTESLAMFVEAITAHDGTGKTVKLPSETKNALTTEQKTAITNAGWTIE